MLERDNYMPAVLWSRNDVRQRLGSGSAVVILSPKILQPVSHSPPDRDSPSATLSAESMLVYQAAPRRHEFERRLLLQQVLPDTIAGQLRSLLDRLRTRIVSPLRNHRFRECMPNVWLNHEELYQSDGSV